MAETDTHTTPKSVKLANEIQAATVTSDNVLAQTVPQGQRFASKNLINEGRQVIDANLRLWDEAQKAGLTPQDIKERHPELITQHNDLEKSFKESSKAARNTAIIAGIGGAAIPLAFHKKISRRWMLAIASVAAGVVTSVVGFTTSLISHVRPVAKKMQDYKSHENAVLDFEIEKSKLAPLSADVPEQPLAGKISAVMPRESSFAAQVTKENEQVKPAEMGK